jgi:peptide/nickel transport system permease protein
LIIAAYLQVRTVFIECIFIGLTSWPWTARAIRAQTFSLRTRDFVDLARLTGVKSLKIIFAEIAPNMMSYLLLVFILQFGGAILTAATLDFIGLGLRMPFLWVDDAVLGSMGRAAIWDVVVVHPTGSGDHYHCGGFIQHECGAG